MPLTIGTTAYSHWQALKPLLEQLGWTPSPDESATTAGITPEFSTQQSPYLFLHTRPEWAVAHALDEGVAPEQALKEWHDSAVQLLQLYKSQRKQAAMVDIISAAEHPRALLEWLKKNHSAFFDVISQIADTPVIEASGGAPTELNLLLATQLVAQNPEVQHLLPQMEACSVPLADEHYAQPTVDVLAVHGHLNQRQSTVEPLAEVPSGDNSAKSLSEASEIELKEENELVINQLFQVQEELEKYYLANKEQGDKLTELGKVKTELEQAKHQAERQQTLLTRSEQALNRAEAQLVTSQQELAEAKQRYRNEDKARLFQTQEELELAVTRIEELVNEQDQLTEKVEYLNEQVDSKNEKLRRLSDEKKQFKARLKLTQEALSQAKSSGGFSLGTIANPLRKLRRSNRLVDQQVHLVETSELFDRDWYAEHNPDVAAKFKNLAEHYVRHGGQEGRDPSPDFSSQGYLENNPDVADSGLNPLAHYLLHGKSEGRKF